MTRSFRERLRSGELFIGTMVTLTTPATAEILTDAGFDWLFLDGEHGPLQTAELAAILQTVGSRIPCVVRVPAAAEVPVKSALDLGAHGVIVPQVNTPETATAVVNWSRYAPEGTRGVGLARAHGYGFRFQDYLDSANADTAVIIQAEHIEAVEKIEQIASVPGIDAVLIGPYDLAASMGRMGDVEHPEVVAAIDRVTSVCQDAGIPLGIFGVTAEAVTPWIAKGYSLITASVDALLLGTAARSIRQAVADHST